MLFFSKKPIIFLFVILSLFVFNEAKCDEINLYGVEAARFDQVNSNIYRGGLPSKDDLVKIKQLGVKSVIDMTITKDSSEKNFVESLDMKYISIPWEPDFYKVHMYDYDKAAEDFLKAISDPNNLPVYVHCLHGKDRTGAMIGVYRMESEQWNANQVIKEMESYGYNRWTHFTVWMFIDRYSRRLQELRGSKT